MVCSDCVAGALHGGTPKGRVETLHTLPTYIADPPAGTDPKGIIVIIADAFGWDLTNNRVLADNYAEKGGYTVYLPDFFNGWAVPGDVLHDAEYAFESDGSYLSKIPRLFRALRFVIPLFIFNRQAVAKPRIYDYLKAIRATSTLNLGVAGFCWGGRYVTLLCQGLEKTLDSSSQERDLVDAGYTAHPSLLSIPYDIEPIKLPYSVAHGTADMNIPQAMMEKYEKALEGKKDVEFVKYEGAKHGFAVRGDPEKVKEKEQGEMAEKQALDFFEKYVAVGR